jgi:hypothetical protein
MSENTEQTTAIIDGEHVDLDVATDPGESKTIVTGMTVSASEKVSTGDYENYEPYQSVRLAFAPPINASDPQGRVEVWKRAMKAHRDLQADLNRAIDNRLADPSFQDWPQGVPPAEVDADE